MILSMLLLLLPVQPAQAADIQTNDFASRLIRSMEYIDYPDVLVAIAAKNPTPWTRYDQGDQYQYSQYWTSTIETRWNQAIALNPTGPIDQQLKTIHQVLMPYAQGNMFRGTPIDNAGGDFPMDPQDAASEDANFGPNNFDRVTDSELAALQANPLLTVLVKPDRLMHQHLIKYRYPSTGTYQKFANQLSPQLLADIHSAEQDPTHPLQYDISQQTPVISQTFQDLNRRIITELLIKAYVATDSPEANYQRMIAVHPFDDYNGRGLRCWYRIMAKRPMFLFNFYDDLYSSPSDFAAAIANGKKGYDMIVAGMQQELNANPNYPHFYENVPQFWMFSENSTTIPSDVQGFISKSENWILHANSTSMPSLLISQEVDHKYFDDVQSEYLAFTKSM